MIHHSIEQLKGLWIYRNNDTNNVVIKFDLRKKHIQKHCFKLLACFI